jgi:hypothetical protein
MTAFLVCLVILVVALIIDPAFCGIDNAQIKAASKAWTKTIDDWTPLAIGGGLTLSGIMFFVNKYAYAIGAAGGTVGLNFLMMEKSTH